MSHRKLKLSVLFVIILMALCFYAVFIFSISATYNKLRQRLNRLLFIKR